MGKGFLRAIISNDELVADIIPVDYSINLMIAVAWHIAQREKYVVELQLLTHYMYLSSFFL